MPAGVAACSRKLKETHQTSTNLTANGAGRRYRSQRYASSRQRSVESSDQSCTRSTPSTSSSHSPWNNHSNNHHKPAFDHHRVGGGANHHCNTSPESVTQAELDRYILPNCNGTRPSLPSHDSLRPLLTPGDEFEASSRAGKTASQAGNKVADAGVAGAKPKTISSVSSQRAPPERPDTRRYYRKAIAIMVVGGVIFAIGITMAALYFAGNDELQIAGPICLSVGLLLGVCGIVWIPIIQTKLKRQQQAFSRGYNG